MRALVFVVTLWLWLLLLLFGAFLAGFLGR